ncbi:MAG: class I SAM-dependent methyltransferase [Spirochaetales bacterium]|nr:class I SAM-dependent methyltransferase [Spirochaetales bacterium]
MASADNPYAALFADLTAPATFRPGALELTRRAVSLAGLVPGMRVLDVGCGTGATVAFLEQELGLQAFGIDPLVRPGTPETRLLSGRGEDLPFTEESFNAVLAECVLSATGKAAKVLKEMCRVLRPEGTALISDLYLREPGPGSFPAGTCPAGATTVDSWLKLFEEAGLRRLVWEDHTRELMGFIARGIMKTGSYREFLHSLFPCLRAEAEGGKYGYFLYLGRKEEP